MHAHRNTSHCIVDTVLSYYTTAQQCLQTGHGGSLPEFMDYHGDTIGVTQDHQVIIPSYKFNCSSQICGNITEWGVDVYGETGFYTLDLQVWRPSPTVNASTGTGCYSLVGNNRFVSVTPSGGVVVVTPSPQDYIQFQPGDVLGFYVEEASLDNNGAVVLNKSSQHTSEIVWLASIEPDSNMATTLITHCPHSTKSSGQGNTLSWISLQAAPVLSIATRT